MVQNEERDSEKTHGIPISARMLAGGALLLVGAITAIWVVANVYDICANPEKLEVFKKLAPTDPALREIQVEDKKILIPMGFFHFFAYFIGGVLLFIAATVACTMISAGAHLLQPRVQTLEAELNKGLAKFNEQVKDDMRRLLEKKGGSG